MATLTFTFKIASVLADADSVVLSDPTGTFGIKRNDTNATVVADATAMTHASTGTYTYEFTPPVGGIAYTYYVECGYAGETHHVEKIFVSTEFAPGTSTMPAEILWIYLVTVASLFTDPEDGDTWPLYINNLPDSNEAPNTSAAIFDTAGIYDGKCMDSTEYQHYGIQIRFRALTDALSHLKAKAIETALAPVTNVEITVESGEVFTIRNISQASPIIRMGADEKLRSNYTINYLLALKEE